MVLFSDNFLASFYLRSHGCMEDFEPQGAELVLKQNGNSQTDQGELRLKF